MGSHSFRLASLCLAFLLNAHSVYADFSETRGDEVPPISQLTGGSFVDLMQTSSAFILLGSNGACSGTLVSPVHVLTAAHCVERTSAADYDVLVGGAWYSVREAYFQRGFTQDLPPLVGAHLDIGMLILSAPVQNVSPTPVLVDAPPLIGQTGFVAGFGLTEVGGSGPSFSKIGTVQIDGVFDGFFRSKFSSTGSSICSGDSGAPVIFQYGEYFAVGGVVSSSDTHELGGSCFAIGDHTSTFVDLQSNYSRSFLGFFPEVQILSGRLAYLLGEFRTAKEFADSLISARSKRDLGLGARRLQSALTQLRRFAEPRRASLLKKAISQAKAAGRARSLKGGKRGVGKVSKTLTVLLGLGFAQ